LSNNAWLAIDTGTVPAVKARELRQAWEEFLGGGEPVVRTAIADSWTRSGAAGVDPEQRGGAPRVTAADEISDRWREHPLWSAAPIIRRCLGTIADADGNLIVVSDADGVLLWVDGPDSVRFDAAEAMNFAEGAAWGEAAVGTNAVGTALAVDHAVQVFAAEHYNEMVQRWTCAAAPVHDPDTGDLLGVIDLTGWVATAHPHSLACAVATAEAVEEHLRVQQEERDMHLRGRFEARVMSGHGQALVTPSGRVLAGGGQWLGTGRLLLPAGGGEIVLPTGSPALAEPLGHEEAFLVRKVGGDERERASLGRPGRVGRVAASGPPRSGDVASPTLVLSTLGHPSEVHLGEETLHVSRRQLDILALLALSDGGLSAEELASELYGDEGHPGTVRVQVFRLRKLLGPGLDTDPYRITFEVRFDVRAVRSLLDRGMIREAVERYGGPLLPQSEAPGIVRERNALEAWLRQAVMTSDDDEALWVWCQSPSGRDDRLAWHRLLGRLRYGDPRHSLVASRVAALRRDLA
jgi:hypothetical protein